VIDPHGYIGDPCAEIGPMIFNPLDCFPKYTSMENIVETRLNILTEMLPFDGIRIKSWAFCLTMRSIGWDIEGFGKPNSQTIEVAKILYNILQKNHPR
jgi:streptomycin 6-kinase